MRLGYVKVPAFDLVNAKWMFVELPSNHYRCSKMAPLRAIFIIECGVIRQDHRDRDGDAPHDDVAVQ